MRDDDVDLLDLARRIAGRAGRGEEIEVYATRRRDTDVEVFGGEVESLSVSGVHGVGIRVVANSRQGFAWAGSLDADLVDDALAEARDNVEFGQPDEWYGLASGADVADLSDRDSADLGAAHLELWRDDLLAVTADDKVQLALELEKATRSADTRVRGVEAAGYGDAAIETAVANSLGIGAQSRRTVCSAYAVAMAGAGVETQTGYGFSAGRTIGDLDLETIPRDASERAVRLLGARQPRTSRLPVILDPLVTRAFLGVLSAAFSGESVLKGRSPFAGREGEEIASAAVSLVDDPTDARALGASTHDSEGVPVRRNELVVGGALRGFLENVYTGRRAGRPSTGSAVRGGYKSMPGVGVRALRMEPGRLSPGEVMASVPEALYVQSVSGLHSGTNPISGDFSVGAEGLMVRAGELAEPVREVTIASTMQRMLRDVAEVGSDLTFLPGPVAGVTLLISEMTMSGA
ncbi:MAG: TldD/PmbA family protein [Acidimicrobiia bacterium]|nr:TldD/PmbA family protein [Acidimicrobiia bacterium]